MTGLQKNTGIATWSVRPEQIGGHEESRQTLINHLLDGVGLILDVASNSRVKRPFVIGQSAHYGEDLFADRLVPAFRGGDSGNPCKCVLPRLQFPLCNS